MKTFTFGLAAMAVVAALSGSASAQTVIYRETFGNTLTTRQAPNLYGWQMYLADGTFFDTVSNTFGVDSTSSPGNDASVGGNINAGPNNVDGDFTALGTGRMFWNGTRRLVWTPEFIVDPALYTPGSIQFSVYIGNQKVDTHERIVVRTTNAGVDNWYFSTTDFTSALVDSAAFATGAEFKTLTFDPAAANWNVLTFDGTYNGGGTPIVGDPGAVKASSTLGVLVSPGLATADLTGKITAFGITSVDPTGGFVTAPTGNARFDTFQISATPIGGGPTGNANFDGVSPVDGNDFLIWQKGLGLTGQTNNANGDADASGTVDGADLQVWKGHFGQATLAAVPEPTAALLALLALAAQPRRARRPLG